MQKDLLRRMCTGVAVSLLVLLAFAAFASAQEVQVIQRARLGHHLEDMTFVDKGPLAGHIVIVDGYEVFAFPAEGRGNSAFKKLFDLHAFPLYAVPRGMAYCESENLFFFNDIRPTTLLHVVDAQGRSHGTRTIKYLNGYLPEHLEGLTYIPASSPMYPDHFAMVAIDSTNTGTARIIILRRDGQVVAEIFPAAPLQGGALGAIAYQTPGRLVVSYWPGWVFNKEIYAIDFAGNILQGPIPTPGLQGFEGLVELRSGLLAGADGASGKLHFMDANYNYLPERDRELPFGVGVFRPVGMAWQGNAQNYLLNYWLEYGSSIFSIPSTLDSLSQIADLAAAGYWNAYRLAYMADEDRIAVVHRNGPRAILLLDASGVIVEIINLTPLWLGRPNTVSYIPTAKQFAVSFLEQPGVLHILSRTGQVDRTIDLTAFGVSGYIDAAYFNPAHLSGGQFLVLTPNTTSRALVLDFYGNFLGEFNYRQAIGATSPYALFPITSGTNAGTFGLLDNEGNELFIFRMN
jgi:hypothetical protein